MYKIVFILFLIGCKTIKTIETKVEKYTDGKTKSITQKIIKKNKGFELHENFRIETNIVRTYFQNGKLNYQTKFIYHNGMDYPCREALYELKQYDSTGVIRLFIQNECDCHVQKEITYNSKGKILTRWKKEVKRLY